MAKLQYKCNMGLDAKYHFIVTGYTSRLNEHGKSLAAVFDDIDAVPVFTFDNLWHPLVDINKNLFMNFKTGENKNLWDPKFMNFFNTGENASMWTKFVKDVMIAVSSKYKDMNIGMLCVESRKKNDVSSIVRAMQEDEDLEYCGCFGLDTLYEVSMVDTEKGIVCVSVFDCESG